MATNSDVPGLSQITPTLTGITYTVNNPNGSGGTEAEGYSTWQQVMDLLEANFVLATQRSDLDFQSTYDLNNVVNIDTEGYLDFQEIAEPSAPSATQIRLWAEDDSGKSMLKYQNGDGVVRELGRDLVHIVRNTSGAQIDKGDVVYISGANGSLPNVELADASDPAKMPAFGLALENIGNNSNGFVLESGDIAGIDTSAFNQGDILYVSASTPGALTATEPTGTNVDQQVGVVIAANAGSGVINVDVKGAIDPALTQTLENKTLTTPKLTSYTVAGVPSASTAGASAMIYVTDESGGAVPAFSDGTNWRRMTDRAIIS